MKNVYVAYIALLIGFILAMPAVATGGGQIPVNCNQDGSQDISDGVCLLDFLFFGTVTSLPCGDRSSQDPANLELLDANGDGTIDLSDVVRLFGFLFLGDPAPVSCTGGQGQPCPCVNIEGCAALCEVKTGQC